MLGLASAAGEGVAFFPTRAAAAELRLLRVSKARSGAR